MRGAVAHARRRASMLMQAHAPRPDLGNIRVSLFRHSTGVPRNSTTTPVDFDGERLRKCASSERALLLSGLLSRTPCTRSPGWKTS